MLIFFAKLEEIVEEYFDAKEAQEFENQDKGKIKWKDFEEVARKLKIK